MHSTLCNCAQILVHPKQRRNKRREYDPVGALAFLFGFDRVGRFKILRIPDGQGRLVHLFVEKIKWMAGRDQHDKPR